MYGQGEDVSTSRFVMGLLCGFALGAIAGLLLAPRPGAELRGRMAESVNRAGRKAKDTYDRASETVNDVAVRAADVADTFANRAATLTARLNSKMSTEGPRPS
jgi:gas vesicle protein